MPDQPDEPDQLARAILLERDRRDLARWYRDLREQAPVHRLEGTEVWLLTGYDACREVLRSDQFRKWSAGAPEPGARPGEGTAGPRAPVSERRARRQVELVAREVAGLGEPMMNPPEHTRYRRFVNPGFAPARIAALRPAITAHLDGLLDGVDWSDEVDLVSSVALPLPVWVVGELIGVPPGDRPRFQVLFEAMEASLRPDTTHAQLATSREAHDEVRTYLGDLIRERRRAPRADLLTELLESRDDLGPLHDDEIVGLLVLLFGAGFHTTTNLVANAVALLLDHPSALAELRRDPTLVPLAVEEALRLESPVQLDARRADVRTEVGGQVIEPGAWAITALGAANRDPARFDRPEEFALQRRSTPVLSFGSGIHHCVGAGLSRLEGEIVLSRLLERCRELTAVEPVRWRPSPLLRSVESLRIRAR